MYSLFINTCINNIVICLYKDGLEVEKEIISGQKKSSQFIMPTIKKVLDGKKIDEIIVANGPGSFTGVRLGVTVAKTLAFTLNVPIYTISTLEVMAVSSNDNPKVIAVKDNNDYYAGVFNEDNSLVGKYQYLTKEKYEKFCEKYHVITEIDTNFNEVYKYVKDNKESINPHKVNPIYIKKISVEK